MRCTVALQTCLALLLAFLVSPFQHIHPGTDHDHAATMHAHFFGVKTVSSRLAGPVLAASDDDDDHDAVWSVDSFTLVPPAALTPFVPARVSVALFEPPVPIAWVDVVDEQGHDPPHGRSSIPRAPPS
jgi:hypothetical protein